MESPKLRGLYTYFEGESVYKWPCPMLGNIFLVYQHSIVRAPTALPRQILGQDRGMMTDQDSYNAQPPVRGSLSQSFLHTSITRNKLSALAEGGNLCDLFLTFVSP